MHCYCFHIMRKSFDYVSRSTVISPGPCVWLEHRAQHILLLAIFLAMLAQGTQRSLRSNPGTPGLS